MTLYRGHILTAFESGSGRFNNRKTHNRISHLHTGLLDRLLQVADPAALHPLLLPGRPQVLLPEQDDDPNPGDLFLGETTDRTLGALPQLPDLTAGLAAAPPPSPSSAPAPTVSATPSATPSPTPTPSQTPSAGPTPSDAPSAAAAQPAADYATHEHDPVAPAGAPTPTPTPAPEDRISDARLTYEQETGRTTS
jgi:hypothetical protein